MVKPGKTLKKAKEKFYKLAAMPYEKYWDLLEKETAAGLENLLCAVSDDFFVNYDGRFLFQRILGERRGRMRNDWQWTPEHKKQVLEVSALF
jgi:hypothetical protein